MSGCPACGSWEVSFDTCTGTSICGNPSCCYVLDDQNIVSDVKFANTSSGAKAVLGQRVAYGGFGSSTSLESRENSINRGHAKIEWMARHLGISDNTTMTAKRMYALAVQKRFTKGRASLHIAAACVYVACRQHQTHHLIIDLADLLRTSVRTLGRVYLKLVRFLHFDGGHVQAMDPSLYLERFASQLNFEHKTQKIVQSACRIVAAMNRDWIGTGRRPVGLCGAALLIASKYHGFDRTAREIADIIRMGESTVITRLREFKKTSTANLKCDEFDRQEIQPPEEPCTELPPRLYRNRFKERLQLERALKNKKDVDYEKSDETDIKKLSKKIEEDLNVEDPANWSDSCPSDGDLEGLLLSKNESDEKRLLWYEINRNYLDVLADREESLVQKLDAEDDGVRKKRKREHVPVDTATESVSLALSRRQVDKSIVDISAIDDLFS